MQELFLKTEFAAAGKLFKIPPGSRRVTIIQIIQITFKIASHLDVHGGAACRHDCRHRIIPLGYKTGEQIVFIGCQDKFADCSGRQKILGNIAGENITEIAGRNGKIDAAVPGLRPDLEPGINIVDNLCKNPGPIDGVDRTQMISVLEGNIIENSFDDGLPVVKSPSDCEIKDIFINNGCHL